MAKKIEGYTPRGYSNANNGLWIFMDRTTDAPATVIIHEGRHKHERVFTDSEVDELIKAGNAMSVAMYQYQMDVDDNPPQKHRDMMNAWEAAVRRFSDPA